MDYKAKRKTTKNHVSHKAFLLCCRSDMKRNNNYEINGKVTKNTRKSNQFPKMKSD